MLFLDGSNDNSSSCHKHPPHGWLAESNSPLSLFFLRFRSTPLHFFPASHQLISPLCPLLSNSLFLSFISSVENGISAFSLPCSHFSSSLCHTPSLSPFFSIPFSYACAFTFPLFSPCHSSHFFLSLCTPVSHFSPPFLTAFFSFSYKKFKQLGECVSHFFSVTPLPSSFVLFFFLCILSLLSLFHSFFLLSCLSSPHKLNLNIRLGFISMTFMAAKPFIPFSFLSSLSLFSSLNTRSKTTPHTHPHKVIGG